MRRDTHNLWGAYDSYMINGSELDGPGRNYWIDYDQPLDTSATSIPLVATDQSLWGDVDACIAVERRDMVVPRENTAICVRE